MSATDALGPQWDQYGYADVHDEAAVNKAKSRVDDATRHDDSRWHEQPVHTLPASSLVPTQTTLTRSRYERQPQSADALGPVKVVKTGGVHYLVDGHHRAYRAALNGESVTARVKNL